MRRVPLALALALALLAPATAGCIARLAEVADTKPLAEIPDEERSRYPPPGTTPTGSPGNRPPVAAIAVEGPAGPRGLPRDLFALDATGSGDRDGTIARYDWRVLEGDTVVLSSDRPRVEGVTFPQPGVRVVRLTVTDDDGATATAQSTLHVDARHDYKGEPVWQLVTGPSAKWANHTVPSGPDGRALALRLALGERLSAAVEVLGPDGAVLASGETASGANELVLLVAALAGGDPVVRLKITHAPETVAGTPVPVPAAEHRGRYDLAVRVYQGASPAIEDLRPPAK
ncbi:MAG TPA: PKD domain-containing protein [Candidatus Thermoplasmatota archaeon]|nr:PKD domain-containing protein [Candidatus Thermoplasmatota archaeon]